MKRVLLIIYSATHFRELSRVARALKQAPDYEPVVFSNEIYPTVPEDEAVCFSLGITSYRREGEQFLPSPPPEVEDQQPGDKELETISIRMTDANSTTALVDPGCNSVVKTSAESCDELDFGSIEALEKPPETPAKEEEPQPELPQRVWREIKNVLRPGKRAALWLLRKSIGAFRRARTVTYRSMQKLKLNENTLVWYLRYRHLLNWTRRVMDQVQPDIIVLAEDNVEYACGAFLRVARERGMKSVIIPFAMAGPEEPAEVYYDSADHSLYRIGNRLLSWFYPQWVHEHRGRHMVRVPSRRAFPLEWLKMSQPLPWVMNSSHADALAVESEFMLEYYHRYGVPKECMRVTGALSDDTLKRHTDEAKHNRKRLCQDLGLLSDLPIILCALPPIHSGTMRWGEEFSGYENMIAFWVEALEKTEGYNIILCLHPSQSYESMKWLESPGWWGSKIARWDTAQMIPLCDIYVASISSTIRWAIACGKPVVNYDVYRFRFTDFDSAEGVVTVEEKEDFIDLLQNLTSDPQYCNEVKARQRASADRWGNLDGQSAARMLRLLDEPPCGHILQHQFGHDERRQPHLAAETRIGDNAASTRNANQRVA